MKILYSISLVILLLFVTADGFAQNSANDLDKVYGLDPYLYNGRLYTYFMPVHTGGTQFINSPDFEPGSVTIRGKKYVNLMLNYDVFNQQLILQYTTGLGAVSQLIVSDAWLESFEMGDAHFEFLAIEDTLPQIYQVIGKGANIVLFSWSKELLLNDNSTAANYLFTKSKRESYLLRDNKLLRFKKNRSFIMKFARESQPALRKYLRQQKINVKKARYQVISDLMAYCNKQLLR